MCLRAISICALVFLTFFIILWILFVPIASLFITSVPYQIQLGTTLDRAGDYIKTKITTPFTYWRQPQVFDFIIVGGGSAGAIVANRLSKHNRVLLLEAGGDPSWYSSIPFFTLEVALTPGTAYAYTSTPQRYGHLASKGIVRIPRGKGLGGSSSVNGMIFIRGSPRTFDEWAEITGDTKWRYENVLPFFKKLEDYQGKFQPVDRRYHDVGGELHLETQSFEPGIQLIHEALQEKGYEYRDSSAGGPKDKDFTRLEHNMKHGARHGTYEAFLKPILNRPLLTIVRYAEVTRVHLDANNRAYGVTYLHHGKKTFARASREVVLSAGAIESPKLLMRSGIGRCDHLHQVGIRCINNLPVGQNLQDHPLFSVLVAFNDTVTFTGNRDLKLGSVWDYFWSGTGPLRSLGLVTTAYRSTGSWLSSDPSFPDLQFQFYGGFLRPWSTIPEPYRSVCQLENSRHDVSSVTVSEYLSKSVGELRLASRRRADQPLINPNYFKDPSDASKTIEGIKHVLEVVEGSAAFKRYNATVFTLPAPACDSLAYRSDAYWECHIRWAAHYVYHPVGTVSMGRRGSGGVVDGDLRVYNTTGLRVIDGSIIPKEPNVNIHGSVLLIGELGAHTIRQHWAKQFLVCPRRSWWFGSGFGPSQPHNPALRRCSNVFCVCWNGLSSTLERFVSSVTPWSERRRSLVTPDDLKCFYSRFM